MGGDVEYQALEAFLLSLEICFDGGRKRKKIWLHHMWLCLVSWARQNKEQDRLAGNMFI